MAVSEPARWVVPAQQGSLPSTPPAPGIAPDGLLAQAVLLAGVAALIVGGWAVVRGIDRLAVAAGRRIGGGEDGGPLPSGGLPDGAPLLAAVAAGLVAIIVAVNVASGASLVLAVRRAVDAAAVPTSVVVIGAITAWLIGALGGNDAV